MSNYDYYYVSNDCGEMYCAACALEATTEELEKRHTEAGDPAGRLLALLRGSKPSDIDDVTRWVEQELCSYHARYNAHNAKRNEAAADLFRNLVGGYNDNGDCSRWGEHCDGCNVELIEEYVVCANCERSDPASLFPFVPDVYADGDQPGDGPTVEYCGSCEDEYVGAGIEPITTDWRGYHLRFIPDYRGRPTYAAGCRRFTLEEALRHWSNPDHFSPTAADQLFRGVLRHAMKRALPNLNV